MRMDGASRVVVGIGGPPAACPGTGYADGFVEALGVAHPESMTKPETVMWVPPSAAKAKQAAPMKIDAESVRNTLSRVTRSHATWIMVHLAAIVA